MNNNVLLVNNDLNISVETCNVKGDVTLVIKDNNDNEIELTKEEYTAIVALEEKSNKLSYELSQGN